MFRIKDCLEWKTEKIVKFPTFIFVKTGKKLKYKTAPKVHKLKTRQASIEEFTVYIYANLNTFLYLI